MFGQSVNSCHIYIYQDLSEIYYFALKTLGLFIQAEKGHNKSAVKVPLNQTFMCPVTYTEKIGF
jgi:hypothetical protein